MDRRLLSNKYVFSHLNRLEVCWCHRLVNLLKVYSEENSGVGIRYLDLLHL